MGAASSGAEGGRAGGAARRVVEEVAVAPTRSRRCGGPVRPAAPPDPAPADPLPHRSIFDTDNIDIGPERRNYLDHELSRIWEFNGEEAASPWEEGRQGGEGRAREGGGGPPPPGLGVLTVRGRGGRGLEGAKDGSSAARGRGVEGVQDGSSTARGFFFLVLVGTGPPPVRWAGSSPSDAPPAFLPRPLRRRGLHPLGALLPRPLLRLGGPHPQAGDPAHREQGGWCRSAA